MMKYLLVFIGGGMGSAGRYFISRVIPWDGHSFPFATLIANLLGCFCMGIAFEFFKDQTMDHTSRIFIVAGILGGFTTFSAFSIEGLIIFHQNDWSKYFIYTLVSILGGLLAAMGGILITRFFSHT